MRVKLSSIINELSGSLNGGIMRMTPHCCVLQSSPIKTNSVSATFKNQSILFGRITKYWRSLTDAERLPWYNTFLDDVSGFNLFVKLNVNSQLIFGAYIIVPPASFEVETQNVVFSVFDVSLNALNFIMTAPAPLFSVCEFYATKPLSAGSSLGNASFALIRRMPLNYVATVGLRTFYRNLYGEFLSVGNVVYVDVYFVSTINFNRVFYKRFRCVCVA